MKLSSASTRSERDVAGGAVLKHGPSGRDGAMASAAIGTPRPLLLPFCFWLPRATGASAPPHPSALRGAIRSHLADLGWPDAEPLRWAITAVEPLRGLQLEGVGICAEQAPQAGR